MSSAAEAELGGLYICAKEMVPLRQSLIEMGWPQPRSPSQCDNSPAGGVTNQTIIPRKTKSMDIQFHWLCCRNPQGQFHYFWAPGATNLGNYSTYQEPPAHLPHCPANLPNRRPRCNALPASRISGSLSYFCVSQSSLQECVDPQVIHLGFHHSPVLFYSHFLATPR